MHHGAAVARVDGAEDLEHPLLGVGGGDRLPAPPRGADHGGEVGGEELEDEDGVVVAVVAPEVVEEGDDVGGAAEEPERVDLAEGALGVVDLLQGDGEAVGAAAAAVDVGVGAGADAAEHLVALRDLGAAVDAPAPGRGGPDRH